MGNYVWKRIPLLLKVFWGGWGFEEHSWPLWRQTIEMFYTYSFLSNCQGERITKKGRYDGNLEFVVIMNCHIHNQLALERKSNVI
jgi:hypothetical protein